MSENSEDPNQAPHLVASDLGMPCLSLSGKKMECLYGLMPMLQYKGVNID